MAIHVKVEGFSPVRSTAKAHLEVILSWTIGCRARFYLVAAVAAHDPYDQACPWWTAAEGRDVKCSSSQILYQEEDWRSLAARGNRMTGRVACAKRL